MPSFFKGFCIQLMSTFFGPRAQRDFIRCFSVCVGARGLGAHSFFKGWGASTEQASGAREGPYPALGTSLALVALLAWQPSIGFSARSLNGPCGLDDARDLDCDLWRSGVIGLDFRTACRFGLRSGVTGLAFKSGFFGGPHALGRTSELCGSFHDALLAARVAARFWALLGAVLGRVPPIGTAGVDTGAVLVSCCTCRAWATRSWRPNCSAAACALDACEINSRLRIWSAFHIGFRP